MLTRELDDAVDAIRAWGEGCAWRGWDPYDALLSPYAGALTLGRPLGRRLLMQTVKRSPLNLRPLLRIPKERDAKGVALAVSGYARLAAARADDTAATAAASLADWLLDAASATKDGIGWGYHFDVETRFFSYRRGEPNAVATAFAAHALLDVAELVHEDLEAPLLDAVAYLRGTLKSPRGHFRYVNGHDTLIHNANLLVCSVLARTARVLDAPELADAVAVPVEASLAAQRADGSWPYSERRGGDWVDNFHTGYVLESLATCVAAVPDAADALLRGLRYWDETLFLPDGTPRASSTATLPLDAHAYAQAIETWLSLAPWRVDARVHAERVAELLVRRMLAPDGHVYFERRRFWLNRTAFVRWTSAASFRALARVLLARAPVQEIEHAHLG